MLDTSLAAYDRAACSPRAGGAKLALEPMHVWGIRIRLQVLRRLRDLALFDLALDSKLRGCDLVSLKVSDVLTSAGIRSRVMILQRKTGRPVQFEVTEQTRRSLQAWVAGKKLGATDLLFPSRQKRDRHLTTRQYGRLVDQWVELSISSQRSRAPEIRKPCFLGRVPGFVSIRWPITMAPAS